VTRLGNAVAWQASNPAFRSEGAALGPSRLDPRLPRYRYYRARRSVRPSGPARQSAARLDVALLA